MAAIYQWFPVGVFYLTSPPYPIEATDHLAFEFAFLGGYTQGVNKESVDISASLLDSDLDVVKLSSDPQVESVDISASLLDSALDLIRLQTEPQPESVDFSAMLLDSTLEYALVRHTNPAEAINWTFEWLGGSTT